MRDLIFLYHTGFKSEELFRSFLKEEGHELLIFEDKEKLKKALNSKKPDILLFDILYNPYEQIQVLEELKEEDLLKNQMVVVLSNVSQTEELSFALKLGADDYLLEPYNEVLLNSRIDASKNRKKIISVEKMYTEYIESYAENLEKIVQERTKELADANQRLLVLDKAKSDFLGLISHELRTPLNAMSALHMLFSSDENVSHEELIDYKQVFSSAYHRLTTIIDQSVFLTKIQVSDAQNNITIQSIAEMLQIAEYKNVEICNEHGCQIDSEQVQDIYLLCDPSLLGRGLSDLLETMIKLAGKEQSVLIHTAISDEENILIEFSTSGGTQIPETYIECFFDVLTVTDSITVGGDLGLAPAIARQVIEFSGGSIEIMNKEHGLLCKVLLKKASEEEVDKALDGMLA